MKLQCGRVETANALIGRLRVCAGFAAAAAPTEGCAEADIMDETSSVRIHPLAPTPTPTPTASGTFSVATCVINPGNFSSCTRASFIRSATAAENVQNSYNGHL